MSNMLSFLAPYKILIFAGIIALVWGGSLVLSYNKGYSRAEDKAAKAQLVAVELAVKKAQEVSAKDLEITKKQLEEMSKTKAVTQTIIKRYRQNAKTSPLNCTLDSTRMQSITDSINRKESPDSSESNYSMPPSTIPTR